MEIVTKTLYSVLCDFAMQDASKRLFFTEGRSYTAGDFLLEVKSLASELTAKGIGKGDMVVLRATRSIDVPVLFFALQALGSIVVLGDPHYSAYEVPSELELPVKAFITNEGAGEGLSAEGNWVLDNGGKKTEIKLDQERKPIAFTEPEDTLYAPAVIIFTSGSTGGQKAVTLSQFNMVNHAYNYAYGGCYRQTDISVEMLPLHHVFGLAVLLTAMVHRYEVYFPETVTPETITESVSKYHVTRLDGVPSLLLSVAKYFEEREIRSNSLRIGVIGGAVISAEQFQYIERILCLRLVPVYGMSECIGITGLPEDAEEEDRRLTVGVFLPLNQGCILNDKGESLPEGMQGEICVKSPVCTLGYYTKGRIVKENVDAAGWLHTGDLGFLDCKGYVHVTGRKKDIIIRNGNNLSGNDIAQKLLSIYGVSDVLVVGIADETAGEVPAAMVVTTEEALFREQNEKVLNRQERLARYCFVEKIPLTASGKPDKMKAKEILSSRK